MSLLRKAAAIPDGPLDPEAMNLLVDEAAAFLRSGLTRLIDWAELDAEEKAAMNVAYAEVTGAAADPAEVMDYAFAAVRARLGSGAA